MQYSVYAGLSVNCWSWHGEIESDDLTSCFSVMVELRTRKREMRAYGRNHHENLGHNTLSCVSQSTIPDIADTSPDPACNDADKRSSQPNQASHTPDFSYPVVSSTLFSSSSTVVSFSSTTLPSSQNTKFSYPSLSLHVMIMSWHWVQHTPSTASTQDWYSTLHSYDYELTCECSLGFRRASLYDQPPSASPPWELKGEVTMSHSHVCELTHWWIQSQHPACRPSSASK